MYELYVIRGRFEVETKIISNELISALKREYLACALEGIVEIRKVNQVLTISEIARAFEVPELELNDYLDICSQWLNLNFFLTKGRWLYDK